MKFSANTYPWLWNSSLKDTVTEICKSGCFKGIEFLISPPHFYLSEHYPGKYREIRKIIDDHGMEVSSVIIPSLDINIASPFPEMRKMAIELYQRLSFIAVELRAKVLVIVPGKRHPLLPPDYDLICSYAKKSVQKILDSVKNMDLVIGIETLPANFIDTPEQLLDFVRDFEDTEVKIVFDSANVLALCGRDPAEALKSFKNDICLIHMSDTNTSLWGHDILGTGDFDYKTFIQAAMEINYEGYLVLEVIDNGGIAGLKKSINILKEEGILP
jgi:sugar phosphate isomerase/epimerase